VVFKEFRREAFCGNGAEAEAPFGAQISKAGRNLNREFEKRRREWIREQNC
jgi:hypothetical protein